jgi:hypothetical protein
MTTKAEMIALLKNENPTLQVGDDERGYTDLTDEDYEAQIEQWAENRLEKEAKLAQEQSLEETKLNALAKLAALGLDLDDLKSLGF